MAVVRFIRKVSKLNNLRFFVKRMVFNRLFNKLFSDSQGIGFRFESLSIEPIITKTCSFSSQAFFISCRCPLCIGWNRANITPVFIITIFIENN